MIRYKLDTITKQGEDYTAYIHIMDGEIIIETKSLIFKNKTDFKNELTLKSAKLKEEYDKKMAKKNEIEQALKEMI